MSQQTPEQNKNLGVWAEERDSLLREIGILQNEKNTLAEANKIAGANYANLCESISEAKGKIDEFNKLEERYKNSLSAEVSELVVQKSVLESEVSVKRKELIDLELEKTAAIELIDTLKDVSLFVNKNLSELNLNAGKINENNSEIGIQIQNLMEIIKQGSQEIIDLNSKNSKETTVILNKLPAMLVELQKAKLIRHKI